jgi:hypothetical protein
LENAKGEDFFSCSSRIDCDLVLANPPFAGNTENRKSPVLVFLEHILADEFYGWFSVSHQESITKGPM